jgi:hypothetical protein
MNTNATAISLAVVLHGVTTLYRSQSDLNKSYATYLTTIDAIEELAGKNGNTMDAIYELERSLIVGLHVTESGR